MNSKSHWHSNTFSMGQNKRFFRKQSELKGSYTDNQTCSPIIAIQPTVLIFKVPTVTPQLCHLCNLFVGDKFMENHVIDIATIRLLAINKFGHKCVMSICISLCVYLYCKPSMMQFLIFYQFR